MCEALVSAYLHSGMMIKYTITGACRILFVQHGKCMGKNTLRIDHLKAWAAILLLGLKRFFGGGISICVGLTTELRF